MRAANDHVLSPRVCQAERELVWRAICFARKQVGRTRRRDVGLLTRARSTVVRGTLYVDDAVRWTSGHVWTDVCMALGCVVIKFLAWSRRMGLPISKKCGRN